MQRPAGRDGASWEERRRRGEQPAAAGGQPWFSPGSAASLRKSQCPHL